MLTGLMSATNLCLPTHIARKYTMAGYSCRHMLWYSQIASSARVPAVPSPLQPALSESSGDIDQVVIGVARDAAFSFYYHE